MPNPSNKKPTWKAPQQAPDYEADLERGLHGIFDGGRGMRPDDMTRLERADHSTVKRVLVGLMAFFAMLAAVSWAGFFFFAPNKARFEGEKVAVTIEGPEMVKSGETVTYAVNYKNGESVALGTASLELRLPKALQITRTDPPTVEGQPSTWQIGSIAPGRDGLLTVEGVALAPLAKQMDVQAILTYRPADFNSEFQKVATRTITVNDSALELTTTGPTKVLPGDKATIKLEWHNSSPLEIAHGALRGAWPDTFIPESATPKWNDGTPAGSPKEWDLGALKPDMRGSVTVTGSFASSAEGSQDVGAIIGYRDEADAFQPQREAKYAATVLKGDLVTALIMNGKAGDQPIRFGDKLRYAVTYKNSGTAALEDVTLTVHATPSAQGKLLRWAEISDRAAGVLKDDTLTWTKKQVPSLELIAAGQEGTLNFEVPFIAAPVANAADPQYSVTSWVEAAVARIDGDKADRVTKTQPIVAKALSDAALEAEARYFNDDNVPVGTGPLPPEVGKPSSYRVTWRVANTLHELSDLKLSARLPPNVQWTGLSTVDAGAVTFDAAGGKMVWTLNWMPTTVKELMVTFDLALTPGEGDRNLLPNIMDASVFEATDKLTGDSLLLSQPPLTTALDGDEFAVGKGKVK